MPRYAFNALTEMEEDGSHVRPSLKSMAPLLNDIGFFNTAEQTVERVPDASLGFLACQLPAETRDLFSRLVRRNLELYLKAETRCIGFSPDLSVLIRKLYCSIPCNKLRFTYGAVQKNRDWQSLSSDELANRLLPLLLQS